MAKIKSLHYGTVYRNHHEMSYFYSLKDLCIKWVYSYYDFSFMIRLKHCIMITEESMNKSLSAPPLGTYRITW